MRAILYLTVCVGLAAAAVHADSVTVNKMEYRDVVFKNVVDGQLVFTLSGNDLRKPLAQISKIEWNNHDEFNDAESWMERQLWKDAIHQYDAALGKATRDWEKALINARRDMAKAGLEGGISSPAAPSSTPATQSADKAKSCYYCNGTGLMPCEECQHTGKGKCPNCNGSGKAKCAACGGNWRQGKCSACNGTGHTSTGKCIRCNGEGYAFVCPVCSKNFSKGYTNCAACSGSGKAGICAVCHGDKKVACTHCDAGQKIAAAQAPKTPEVAQAGETKSTDPLDSPVNLARLLESTLPVVPADNKGTEDQWIKDNSSFLEMLESQKKIFVGKKVSWKVYFDNAKLQRPGLFRVRATMDKSNIITAYLEMDATNPLLTSRRGVTVRMEGEIADLRFIARASDATGAQHGAVCVLLEKATLQSAE